MKKMKMLAAGLMMFCVAAAVRGEDAPAAAPAPAKASQPFVRASIASSDKVKQALTTINFPIPLDLAALLEGKFPFIGAGGIDTTKPVGLVAVVGENLEPQQMMMFAFPVNAGKANLADFKANGATNVEGENDMVTMGPGVLFRRTADYLFMYMGDEGIIKSVGNDPFGKDYQKKATLAHIEIDAATARTVAPKAYKQFMETVREKSAQNAKAPKNAAEAKGQEFGREMVMNFLEKLEKLTVSLALDEKSLHLGGSFSPSPVKGKREFFKPVFGPNVIVSGDIVYPDAESALWGTRILKLVPDSDLMFKDKKLTPEQVAQERKSLEVLLSALVGDSQSFAVSNVDGKPLVVVVNQYQREVNLPQEIRREIQNLSKLAIASGEGVDQQPIIEDVKAADGSAGIRMTSGPKDKSQIGFTVTQRGKTAVITVTPGNLMVTPAVVTISPTEKISDFATVTVDIGAAVKLGGEGKMPPEQQKMLVEKLGGKLATLKLASAGNSMTVDLEVPTEVIKILPTLGNTGRPHTPEPGE